MKKLSYIKLSAMFVAGIILAIGSLVLGTYMDSFDDALVRQISLIAFYVLLAGGALLSLISLILFIVKIAKKKVSEFALHVMRFSIIIVAVCASVFIMLESDYTAQRQNASDNELKQQTLAASIYLREQIGENVESGYEYMANLTTSAETLLADYPANETRTAAFYLFDGAAEDGTLTLQTLGANEIALASDYAARVAEVEESNALIVSRESIGGNTYSIASAPVFTTTGRCVGVLEIYDNLTAEKGLKLINFELVITVVGAVLLLIILYYALSHLVDILLRPRKLVISRAMRMGNETARPISLLMCMCCTMPLCPIFFDYPTLAGDVLRELLPEASDVIPAVLVPYIPLLLYMLMSIIGAHISDISRKKLYKAFIAFGGIVCAGGLVCTLLLDEPLYKLIGIGCAGLGYGIASRMVDRYRVYARYSPAGDAKVIYSPYLGLAAGALLGAFMYVRGGAQLLFAGTAGLVMLIVILTMALFTNASCEDISREGDEDFLNEAYERGHGAFGRFGLLAVATSLLLSFGWFYLSVYLGKLGITTTAITFGFACVILGGGVLGNLYRKAETPVLRFMFGLAGIFLAASIVPFAIVPCKATAIICYFLMFIAEILGHGTINAYLTQKSNSRDRIGYWGQGNVLLELVSVASVVGGIYLLNMDNPVIALIAVAVLVIALAIYNLVMITSTKPTDPPPVLAVVEDVRADEPIVLEKPEDTLPDTCEMPVSDEPTAQPASEEPKEEAAEEEYVAPVECSEYNPDEDNSGEEVVYAAPVDVAEEPGEEAQDSAEEESPVIILPPADDDAPTEEEAPIIILPSAEEDDGMPAYSRENLDDYESVSVDSL